MKCAISDGCCFCGGTVAEDNKLSLSSTPVAGLTPAVKTREQRGRYRAAKEKTDVPEKQEAQVVFLNMPSAAKKSKSFAKTSS
jgi:hypothetical protein